jgi:hypothetical protein
MSALNGIVQREAVHLLTDGASYRSDGRIFDIGSKIQAFPAARVAIGWAGFNPMEAIRKGIRKHKARTALEILAALPSILRDTTSDYERVYAWQRRFPVLTWLTGSEPHPPCLSVLVALWDDGPQLWAIHSDNEIDARLEPFVPVRLMRSLDLMPGTEPAVFGREVAFEDRSSFDPARDGLALLEHQRREPWAKENGDQYLVGGFAELTTVSADGVHQRRLDTWPDKIGRKIEPQIGEQIGGQLAWAR